MDRGTNVPCFHLMFGAQSISSINGERLSSFGHNHFFPTQLYPDYRASREPQSSVAEN
jgi:hypothetical protein